MIVWTSYLEVCLPSVPVLVSLPVYINVITWLNLYKWMYLYWKHWCAYLCGCVCAWEAGSEWWSTSHRYHTCTGAHQCGFDCGSENSERIVVNPEKGHREFAYQYNQIGLKSYPTTGYSLYHIYKYCFPVYNFVWNPLIDAKVLNCVKSIVISSQCIFRYLSNCILRQIGDNTLLFNVRCIIFFWIKWKKEMQYAVTKMQKRSTCIQMHLTLVFTDYWKRHFELKQKKYLRVTKFMHKFIVKSFIHLRFNHHDGFCFSP